MPQMPQGVNHRAATKTEIIPDVRDFHRWVVFGIIASIYFLVYFHRVSTSVIAPDLLTVFQTDATALGFMSSMYFYVYALEQPLVGYLTDRLGPRRVISFWTLTTAFGCLVFGFAPTIGWASVGRAIIGFGVGGVYVPGLKAISQWFETKEFSTMTGLFLGAGNLGALVATAPLVWMAQAWGWRVSFHLIAGITVALAVAAFFLTRDHTPPVSSTAASFSVSESPSPRESSPSIISVLTSFHFWIYGTLLFGIVGTLLTLQGLWATPYLISKFGIQLASASKINLLIPLGFIAGSPLWGWLGSRFRNKMTLLIGLLIITVGMWSWLIISRTPGGMGGVMIVMFVIGCAAGGLFTMLWTLVRESTPVSVLGLTLGLLNPFPMFGIAVFQVMTGAVLDRVGRTNGIYPFEAYQDAFVLCLAVTVVCLAIALIARKRCP